MGAHKGNQYNKKLTTSQLKKEAYRQYCEHIAAGFTKKSWCFDHPELTLTWETMEKYIKNDKEFDPIKKEIAKAKGLRHWEQILDDAAKGINKEVNIAGLQIVLRNKYGWDKDQKSKEETQEPMVQKLAKLWRGDNGGSNDE